MNIIPIKKSMYNIGINAGDNITNIILNKNDIIPTQNKISFIIPELEEEYNILLVMGDNILASDNIILDNIHIKTNEKVIYIHFLFNISYIFLKIETKGKVIYTNVILYYDNNIDYIIKDVDIELLKNQFEIIQLIKLIRKKITRNHIILSNEEYYILDEKLLKITNNLCTISNQKLLDIKNTLKNKFFLN
jgi:hypothetical protein